MSLVILLIEADMQNNISIGLSTNRRYHTDKTACNINANKVISLSLNAVKCRRIKYIPTAMIEGLRDTYIPKRSIANGSPYV